jgi:hypothetical protein
MSQMRHLWNRDPREEREVKKQIAFAVLFYTVFLKYSHYKSKPWSPKKFPKTSALKEKEKKITLNPVTQR